MSIEKLRPSFTFTEDRLRELQQVVPEAFADGKINWVTLREALGEHLEDEGQEHFGLTWPGKREAHRLAAMPSKGALIPDQGKGINEDTTHNIFIEGDNLEVLKLLQKSYARQIDLIYIDPPYNTGDDFIYPDDYSEPLTTYLQRTGQISESGKKLTTIKISGQIHSNWLSMLYPRLLLARNLLTTSGIIAVHIDEHECSLLSTLMSEVFGEENNIGTIIWDKKNPKGDSTGIAYQHESIIVFAKNRQLLLLEKKIERQKKNAQTILDKAKELFSRLGKQYLPNGLQECVDTYNLSSEMLQNHLKRMTLEDINRDFAKWIKNQNFSGGESAYSQIDENGEVYQSVSMAWPNKKKAPDDYFLPLLHPITQKACPIPARGWRNPSQTMKKLLDNGLILFGPDETTQPRRKYLLRENMQENIPSILPYGGSDDALLNSMGIPFDNPKPVEVSKQIIQGLAKPDGIVLDFFAGSCTAAHAVMELNLELNRNMKFIMVQFPEPVSISPFSTIAEIGRDRIIKAISLLKKESSQNQDLGFTCFALESSHFKDWSVIDSSDIQQLEMKFTNTETPLNSGWKPSFLMAEILLLQGFPLDSRVRVLPAFHVNYLLEVTHDFCSHKLYICLDEKIVDTTIDTLSIRPEDIFVCLDTALTDEAKLRLSDRCHLKVI